MKKCIVFEDGNLISNLENYVLWDGLFSRVSSNGAIVKYIQSCLPKNTVFVIPPSDGNITRDKDNKHYSDTDWDTVIQPYLDYAKGKNKKFMISVVCQKTEEGGIRYVYLPQDDTIFEHGITTLLPKNKLPAWENRSSELCWRGGCSGIGGGKSLRVQFVETIYRYNRSTNVRLSTWWSEGKNIPAEYFADRIHYSEFFNYKIFFIVDGNGISSSHMYGFASGAVPFLISNSICWFSHLITPYVHYIPVNYDLSNLIEQIEWVNNNDDKAKQIADNAYQFAETHFSSEYQKQYIQSSINACIGDA
jgi:hypothetical protein